jgi:hypothetical protein
LPDICQASHRGNRNDKKPTPTEHRVCKPFQITVTENHITVFGKCSGQVILATVLQ